MERLRDIFRQHPEYIQIYRAYEKGLCRAKTRKLQHQFLKTCLQEKILPRTLSPATMKNKCLPFTKIDRIILEEHIQQAKREVDEAFYTYRKCLRDLTHHVDPVVFNNMKCCAERTVNRTTKIHENRLKRKLERLFNHSLWVKCSNYEKNVLNMSSHVLGYDEKLVLGYGLSFSTESSNVFNSKHLVSLVKTCRDNNQDFDFLSGCLVGSMCSENVTDFSDMPIRFRNAINKLKRNKDIHITKSDKTNQIVILDSANYLSKLNDLLNDAETYEKLTSNPLQNKVTRFNSKLSSFLKKKYPELHKKFVTVNPSLPYLYGLPKTHKQECPLRPIISNVNSPTSKLSKWLASHLSKAVGKISSSHIINGVDFVSKVNKINVAGHRMVSLDVNSLFTKVPIDETIAFLKRKLPTLNLDLPLPVSTFIKLIELCLTDNVFQSPNGSYYRQRFGLAMGNSLSAVLSNLFMEYFETEILPTIPDHPKTWFRYVDDIFSLWPEQTNFQSFFQNLNNAHPHIKFKVEWENNDCLPFLDTLITKRNDKLKFSVFRKPTNSNAYIHFFSVHDDTVKKSTISTMFLRALRICDPEFLQDEIDQIFSIFKELSYPRWFIQQALLKARKVYYSARDNNVKNMSKFVTLPYNPNISELKNVCRNSGVEVAYNYPKTIGKQLIVNKPKIDTEGFGVYAAKCMTCPKIYIGETGKSLKDRFYYHKRDVRVGNTSSSIFNHVAENNHRVDLEHPVLLFKSQNAIERKIVESTLIKKLPNFNNSEGQYKLNDIVNSLIFKKLVKHDNIGQILGQNNPHQPGD